MIFTLQNDSPFILVSFAGLTCSIGGCMSIFDKLREFALTVSEQLPNSPLSYYVIFDSVKGTCQLFLSIKEAFPILCVASRMVLVENNDFVKLYNLFASGKAQIRFK